MVQNTVFVSLSNVKIILKLYRFKIFKICKLKEYLAKDLSDQIRGMQSTGMCGAEWKTLQTNYGLLLLNFVRIQAIKLLNSQIFCKLNDFSHHALQ